MTDLLKKAIGHYFGLGFEVFPCRMAYRAGAKAKEGLWPTWKEPITQDAALAMLQPSHNTLVLKTGSPYKLWVVDVDQHPGKTSGFDTLAKNGIAIPGDVPCQVTQSGGRHYFFRFPAGLNGSSTGSRDQLGIDMRGDGGLLFVAPTQIEGGGSYRFEVKLRRDLPEPPEALMRLLFPPAVEGPKETEVPTLRPSGLSPKQQAWLDRDLHACATAGVGHRSEADFAVLCTCLRLGLSPEAAWGLVYNVGKFADRGRSYFDTTWLKADAAVPPADRGSRPAPAVERKPSVSQIVRAADISSRIDKLYHDGLTRGESTGWSELDTYYTVARGQLTIITGIPSHGKSTFIDALLVNLAMRKNWRFVVFSPESYPFELHVMHLSEKYIGQPFFGSARMDDAARIEAEAFISDHFAFIDSEDATLDTILDATAKLKTEGRVDGLVIDPWNELETARPRDQSETEYIGQSLKRCRQFARRHDVALWIAAHPLKLLPRDDGTYPVPRPYDISGSSHWYNKADNILTVYRNFEDGTTDVHIQKIKVRYFGQLGKVTLTYDPLTGRYTAHDKENWD